MFKKLAATTAAAIFVLLLFVSVNAKAASFTDNQTVDAQKIWTIHFNQDVVLDDASKKDITVVDSKGNLADVCVSLGQDNTSIIVSAPSVGYTEGERYTLTIGDKVHSKNNKNLRQDVKINFNIKQNIPDISDDEVKKLIYNADTEVGDIGAFGDSSQSIEEYSKLKDNVNTYDKLFNYFNKYFSQRKSNAIINTKEFMNMNNNFYILEGNRGVRFSILESQVEHRAEYGNKLSVTLIGYYQDDISTENPCRLSFTLVYENGRWLVDDAADYDWNVFDYRDNKGSI